MSKMKYYKQAETLFLQEGLSADEICKTLNVSRRTIFYWREKYEWDRKRAEKLATKENFSNIEYAPGKSTAINSSPL